MTKIGVLSDTHSFLDRRIVEYFKDVDEVWHAGDIGDRVVADELLSFKKLRAVHGNIDGSDIRKDFPEHLKFQCENVKVWITHIGGSPGKYAPDIRMEFSKNQSGIFVCGHSHILLIKYVEKYKMLHINPGAAGNFGQQKVRTILRFEIDGNKIQNMEVIELGMKER